VVSWTELLADFVFGAGTFTKADIFPEIKHILARE
jgi:hypothetical protein